MTVQGLKEFEKPTTHVQPAVYWIQWPPNSELIHQWNTWKACVQRELPSASEPQPPLHCTMLYDETQQHTDYRECWKELVGGKIFSMVCQDLYVGPQGAAAAVILPPELRNWFQVANSTPHVTLMVAVGKKAKDMGPMVKKALQITTWKPTQKDHVQSSASGQYLKISLRTYDEGTGIQVLLSQRSPTQAPLSEEHSVLLLQIPQELWSQHKTDVGLVRSAQPVQIKTKQGIILPYKKQYPLKPHQIAGIEPTIKGLVAAGVLKPTKSPCNTPIFPIKKPHSKDYRLVHDLRAINAIVDAETPVVPDPHTLLSNILHDACWYTVIDLCSAFFSVPLHLDSQYLFAFTYKNQQYTYTRLAQGYVDSPSIFNRVLANDLQHLNVTSTVLQYVDDLLVCSLTKEQCVQDSLSVLQALARGGHKVSKDKLQFCQTQVEYLGRQLCGNKRAIAPSQIEAVSKAPKPQTVGHMLSFLGMTGFSRPWICDYAIKTAPLRGLIRAAGQTNGSAELQWTAEAEGAFLALKHDLQQAPVLGNPNYANVFHLYVAEKAGYACAVLMQDTPTGKQPLAYYSTTLKQVCHPAIRG